MALIDLTNENFDQLIDQNKLMLIDFWAEWCAPCKAFAPIFAAAAEQHPDILFARIDTDREPILAKQFEIRSIPTLIGVHDGTIVQVKVGTLPPDKLASVIKDLRRPV